MTVEANVNSLLSTQMTKLSVNYKILDSLSKKSFDDSEKRIKQAIQPAIRLQGSVDFSLNESKYGSNEESDDNSEVKIKEENNNDATTIVPPNLIIFTISLDVQIAIDDY